MTTSWYSDLPQFYQRQIKAMGLDDAGMSRRRMLKTAAAAAGTAAFGLGGLRRANAATSITYMCWEGYNDPKVIDSFKAANDVDIAFDLIIDSPGGFAKLQAGASREVDIISTDLPWVTRLGPAGLALELDPAEYADAYSQLYDQFKPPFTPLIHDGKTIGVPVRWGWVGPCVNTDVTDPSVWNTYDPVFDPKYGDKICIMDFGDWPIYPLVLHAGINPFVELDTAALNEARKVLRAAFKNTRTLVGDLTLAQRGLLDGSLLGAIGTGSYLTSALRKQGHKNVATYVPEPRNGLKQGVIWVDATAVIAETDQPEIAKKLVKHLLAKDTQHALSLLDTTSNPVPNKAVEAEYTAEEKSILQVDYMWEAWERSHLHQIAPSIDQLLQIWQEELAAS